MLHGLANEVILHYYTGKGFLQSFGHVAIEFNGHYYSYGQSEGEESFVNSDRQSAIEADKIFYGEHIPIRLSLTKENVNLSHWKTDWKPNEYSFLFHNCAHSALSCLETLGIVEKLEPATRNKLERDGSLRRILRPAELAEAMLKAATVDINIQRSRFSTKNRLNITDTSQEEIKGLIKTATDILSGLSAKEEKDDVTDALNRLVTQLRGSQSIVEIKMHLKETLLSFRESNKNAHAINEIQGFLVRIQAIEPDIKTRLENLINDEIHLFAKISDKKIKEKQAPLYIDLMLLQYRLPNLKIAEINKEISELLLKYPLIPDSMANNFIHCQFAINTLKPAQQIFYEQEYAELKSQLDIKQRYQDLYEKVSYKAKKTGITNFVHEALTQLLKESIEQPNNHIDDNIKKFNLLDGAISNLQSYLKTYNCSNTFQYVSKYDNDEISDILLKFSDSKISLTDFSLAFENLLKARVDSMPKKITFEPDKRTWTHEDLEWLKYKLANLMFWHNTLSPEMPAQDIVVFMQALQMIEEKHESNTANYIFNQQLAFMIEYWENNNTDKRNVLARDIGLILQQIDKSNKIEELSLPVMHSPHEHIIREEALLRDNGHANNQFAELCFQIRDMTADSPITAHLKDCALRLKRFNAIGNITPQQAIEELGTEINRALKTAQESKKPELPLQHELMSLNQFLISQTKVSDQVASLAPQQEPLEIRLLTKPEVIEIIKSALLESDIAPNRVGKMLKLLNLKSDDNVLLKVKTAVLGYSEPNPSRFLQAEPLQNSGSLPTFFGQKIPATNTLYAGMIAIIDQVEANQPIPSPAPNQKLSHYLAHFKGLELVPSSHLNPAKK
ncbi:MAG: hypothetical protein P4M14_04245 [Gammaproteobacteria bacterium]|nr:hypothetical protein [Gammaproteobacteria bacterium]